MLFRSRHSPPKPRILRLKILQSLDLVALQAPELLAPTVIGNLRNAYRANRVGDRVTLRNQHVYLTQLDASIYASAGAVLIGEVQISASERGGFFR